MLRIANYSFVYSFNVRVTFKTNEGVCKETTEWTTLETSVFHMSRALTQWLMPATDDRVVAGSNPSE